MSDTKICPFCGEEIKSAAIKCRHCGEFLNKSDEKVEIKNQEEIFQLTFSF